MVSTASGTPPSGIAPPPPDEAEEVDPDHRSFQPMSLRGPALIVLGIAVFIVVAGIVASALGSGTTPTLSIRTIAIPDGTVVHLTPAATALQPIVSAGEPPADILGNLAVPAASPVVRTVNTDQNATQFDRTVFFRTGLSSDQVVDVYRTLLPRLGWKVIYVGSGAQRGGVGTQVLARKGSGDGFYWEVGAVVSPTTATGTTPFSLQLFERSDDN
ncbi:MAG TPA: hypothetical protein VGY51_03170 [Acidimicrobiales bacterium]|nr:hypothetical protein [Acidimicrobiales bacterium]